MAVTGASSGIGQGIATRYRSLGWTVVPLSRTDGYDIVKDFDRCMTIVRSCDVFVNNAYVGFYGVDWLYLVFEEWKNQDKVIINIGSDSADGVKDFVHPYSVVKASMDHACEQLQNVKSRCRVINLRPGYVDTPRVREIQAPKLAIEDIVKTVQWCLDQPAHVYVRNVSIRARENVESEPI